MKSKEKSHISYWVVIILLIGILIFSMYSAIKLNDMENIPKSFQEVLDKCSKYNKSYSLEQLELMGKCQYDDGKLVACDIPFSDEYLTCIDYLINTYNIKM